MSIARAYANALFQATKSMAAELDETEKELQEFVAAVELRKEAKIALYGPLVPAKEKVELVSAIVKKAECSKLTADFLMLLARKNRLGVLNRIREEFSSIRIEAQGGVSGRLVSAEALDPAELETLVKAFSRKLGKPITFRTFVDPALVAGVKVTVNGVTYDGTLRAQLERLRDEVTRKNHDGQAGHA
ncbi:MAG TPA: ATP synthase F1 subunit delta [Bdellovibrionota bacterium]|nr:ATP synthase F1 subunit delta [Bdellovibrionota bacterium]